MLHIAEPPEDAQMIAQAQQRPSPNMLSSAQTLSLDGPGFGAFLARHEPFAVSYGLGSFLVIAERRRRRRYWIARAYHDGQRASAYIGRRVDLNALREAADLLMRRLTVEAAPPASVKESSKTRPTPDVLMLDEIFEHAIAALPLNEQAEKRAAYQQLRELAAFNA